MQISYLWLRELTGLDWPAQEIATALRCADSHAKRSNRPPPIFTTCWSARFLHSLKSRAHRKSKKADRYDRSQQLELICGAPNVAVGQKVPVATIGARDEQRDGDQTVTIAACSHQDDLLGSGTWISDDHSGIMVLAKDAPIGKPLAQYLDYDDYIPVSRLRQIAGTRSRQSVLRAISLLWVV